MRVAGATAEVFTVSALREVHRLSHGVPRVINVISDRTLLGAFTREEHRAGGSLVRAAASEVYGRPVPAPWLKWATAGAVVAALALVTVGAVSLWSARRSAPEPAAMQPHEAAPPAAPAPATPAPQAAPLSAPVQPQLQELLVGHASETTTEGALGQLFALWGATYDPAKGRGCDQAAAQGLDCLFQKGSWAQLRTLNRPAILTLTDDTGRNHQVVLAGLTDDTATLRLGGEPCKVPIAEASRYWFGDFLLLWRPPMAVAKSLGPGMRGDDVRWLRDSLRAAQGLPATPGGDAYDADLTRLVQDFQRQHRLAVDGVAGVQTQIVLDTVIRATGSPTIVTASAGG
jgi:general secretion pathway protein A